MNSSHIGSVEQIVSRRIDEKSRSKIIPDYVHTRTRKRYIKVPNMKYNIVFYNIEGKSNIISMGLM